MTGTAPAGHDEFVFHGGRRRSLRFWLLVLPVLLVVSVIALVGALNQGTSDDSGGAGHIVIPAFVAVASVLGLVVTLSQWWEDATFFVFDGAALTARHGSNRMRGKAVTFARTEPLHITTEGTGGNAAVFVAQGGDRVRLGETATSGPLQQPNLEAWLRTRGFTVEHR